MHRVESIANRLGQRGLAGFSLCALGPREGSVRMPTIVIVLIAVALVVFLLATSPTKIVRGI
jgi:hypothetical protein